MTTKTSMYLSAEGPGATRKYSEGPVEVKGDIRLHHRYFIAETADGLVAGKDFNVMFTIDRPAAEIWPYAKDFNLWQNAYGYYYSGVVGDLEGKSFTISVREGEKTVASHPYHVLRVIPEYLIVVTEPVPDDASSGGISPGFHTFMLNEHEGKTTIAVVMEHAVRTRGVSVQESLLGSQKQAPESHRFWRDIFIPNLKKLVYENAGRNA